MKPRPVCVTWAGDDGGEYEGWAGFVCFSGEEAAKRRLGISTKAGQQHTEGEGE